MDSISSNMPRHNWSPKHPLPIQERFWSKVDTSGECWLWTACLDHKGYGRFHTNYNTGKYHHIGAHRMAYILTYGDIPEGLVVCHRCDNPRCIRPEHLFLGTLKDNSQDSVQKGRNSPPPRHNGDAHWTRAHPQKIHRGEQAPNAKLNAEQVKDIRAKYSTGHYTLLQIGQMYGVGKTHIHKIIHNLVWKGSD